KSAAIGLRRLWRPWKSRIERDRGRPRLFSVIYRYFFPTFWIWLKEFVMDNGSALSGNRVIDCGTYVAGPAAATVMSDFGADVIKIERPGGGDLWRLFSQLPGSAKSEMD